MHTGAGCLSVSERGSRSIVKLLSQQSISVHDSNKKLTRRCAVNPLKALGGNKGAIIRGNFSIHIVMGF